MRINGFNDIGLMKRFVETVSATNLNQVTIEQIDHWEDGQALNVIIDNDGKLEQWYITD
jgi:hypothetical protein